MHTLTVFVVVTLAGVSVAMPQIRANTPVPLVSREESREPTGDFKSNYQTGDGILVKEAGSLKPTPDGSDQVLVKDGAYAYTSPEGVQVAISWRADENGFNAFGKNIPVSSAASSPTF